VTFRAQSGELIEGIWHQGSFDVALAATDLDGARAEIDKRLDRPRRALRKPTTMTVLLGLRRPSLPERALRPS